MNPFLVLFVAGWKGPENRARPDEWMESILDRYGEAWAQERVWDRVAEQTTLVQLIGYACDLACHNRPENAEYAGGSRLASRTEALDALEREWRDGTPYTRPRELKNPPNVRIFLYGVRS